MPTVANYGLLWEREKIFWGWRGRGRKGHLHGYKSKQNSITADFREQVGVYVLHNADLRPIYVGKAGFGQSNLFARLKIHDIDHLAARWKYFSWFGAYRVSAQNIPTNKITPLIHTKPDKKVPPAILTDAIREIEAILIQVVEPSLNKRGGD